MSPYIDSAGLTVILHDGVTVALVALGIYLYWRTGREPPKGDPAKTSPTPPASTTTAPPVDKVVANSMALRAIVSEEEGQWVAQCLEFDIGAQADCAEEARIRLEMVLHATLNEYLKRGQVPFADLPPAPAYFQKLWEGRSSFESHANFPATRFAFRGR